MSLRNRVAEELLRERNQYDERMKPRTKEEFFHYVVAPRIIDIVIRYTQDRFYDDV